MTPKDHPRPASVDTAAIAELLGVTRIHVTDRLTKHPTFPEPIIDISQRMRRWDRGEVMAWAASVPRKPRKNGGQRRRDAEVSGGRQADRHGWKDDGQRL